MLFLVQTVSGFCVLCEVVLFLVQTVSVFSLLRRLGCVHQHQLRCADAICVGMCSFLFGGVHRGTSEYSREHAPESHS